MFCSKVPTPLIHDRHGRVLLTCVLNRICFCNFRKRQDRTLWIDCISPSVNASSWRRHPCCGGRRQPRHSRSISSALPWPSCRTRLAPATGLHRTWHLLGTGQAVDLLSDAATPGPLESETWDCRVCARWPHASGCSSCKAASCQLRRWRCCTTWRTTASCSALSGARSGSRRTCRRGRTITMASGSTLWENPSRGRQIENIHSSFCPLRCTVAPRICRCGRTITTVPGSISCANPFQGEQWQTAPDRRLYLARQLLGLKVPPCAGCGSCLLCHSSCMHLACSTAARRVKAPWPQVICKQLSCMGLCRYNSDTDAADSLLVGSDAVEEARPDFLPMFPW